MAECIQSRNLSMILRYFARFPIANFDVCNDNEFQFFNFYLKIDEEKFRCMCKIVYRVAKVNSKT